MKNIVIFEDGKGARGIRAKFIKRDKRRVLIQFLKYDFETDKEELVSEWFKLYIPAYTENKKEYKYNNKRNYQMYCHEETNMFYSDYYQTEEYRKEMKEYISKEYYNQLFGLMDLDKIKDKVGEF
tara:strand:- start:2844 stop:3218 length:375 start_codon:yes stop_codon:yes gene_type:complete